MGSPPNAAARTPVRVPLIAAVCCSLANVVKDMVGAFVTHDEGQLISIAGIGDQGQREGPESGGRSGRASDRHSAAHRGRYRQRSGNRSSWPASGPGIRLRPKAPSAERPGGNCAAVTCGFRTGSGAASGPDRRIIRSDRMAAQLTQADSTSASILGRRQRAWGLGNIIGKLSWHGARQA